MRKLLIAATVTVASLGLGVTAAAADPDPAGACKTYFNDTTRITKREHSLEIAAAWAGQSVDEYCGVTYDPAG